MVYKWCGRGVVWGEGRRACSVPLTTLSGEVGSQGHESTWVDEGDQGAFSLDLF